MAVPDPVIDNIGVLETFAVARYLCVRCHQEDRGADDRARKAPLDGYERFCAYCEPEQTGGTITGLISDPAGAVVANAPVEVKNTATGVVATASTSATGNYVLAALPAGTYEITANVPGFKKYVRTGVEVQQLQTLEPCDFLQRRVRHGCFAEVQVA